MLSACPDITKMDDGKLSTITSKLVDVAGDYYICQKKQQVLSDALIKASE